MKYGNDFFNLIPPSVYYSVYQKVIIALLEPGISSIKVAALADDDDVILGYSVLTKHASSIHWVFVKDKWRGIGIMKSLVPDTVVQATHITNVGVSLIKKFPQITFNPFLLTLGEM